MNQFDHHHAEEDGKPIVESSTMSDASLAVDDGRALLYGMNLILRTRYYPMPSAGSVLDGESRFVLTSGKRARPRRSQP